MEGTCFEEGRRDEEAVEIVVRGRGGARPPEGRREVDDESFAAPAPASTTDRVEKESRDALVVIPFLTGLLAVSLLARSSFARSRRSRVNSFLADSSTPTSFRADSGTSTSLNDSVTFFIELDRAIVLRGAAGVGAESSKSFAIVAAAPKTTESSSSRIGTTGRFASEAEERPEGVR
mgnify:CR=1 FL=1